MIHPVVDPPPLERTGLQVTGYGLQGTLSRPDIGCHFWQGNYQEFWYACTCHKAV